MWLSKRSSGMMPNYLNPKPDESDFVEFNKQLNTLPDFSVKYSEAVVSRNSQSNNTSHIGIPRQLSARSDEKEQVAFVGDIFQSEIDYHQLKRRRCQAPVKLNFPPWNDSSRLPPLQLSSDSPQPTCFNLQQNYSIPLKSFEEDSSYARRYSYTSTMPVNRDIVFAKVSDTTSGCSVISKIDFMNSSPMDNNHVQGLDTSKIIKPEKPKPIKVYSFADFMSNKEMQIQTEKRRLNDEKLRSGVDIVEPMKCDEGNKCEVNAETLSPKKRNKRDVSLVERFTEEEMKLHIMSLKEGNSQGGIREICDLKEEGCQLCGEGRVMFPPQPIYCSRCTNRIKENSLYYIPEEELSDAQLQICNPCYNRSKSKFMLSGSSISKAKMLQKNNLENQIPEEWVQCEACEKWQHQICGLYNVHKDTDKTADYICPHCLLEERKSTKNSGFDDNTDLGAKDLPETILSHFIEQRLFRRLKEERYQTAKATGKNIDDVLEPKDLTLRVVFSDDRTSVVNKQLVDFLQKDQYPSEFPFRAKVILLYQKVEGVDVFIFALFVQEFGSECSLPNQRSVYVLYIDSVKYFRPERVTFAGEALRTFVYHEILIGYLEYCKIRGFTTAYIWACPPPKGEDYIMNSHPKAQQTPSTKKLRKWYVSMLDKAAEQGVVTNVTNLYDRFFVSREESTCNNIAARLPYFEGAFWSYNSELLIQEIGREGDTELQKKVNSLSKRKLKGLCNKIKDFVDVDDAKSILVMEKLEKMISLNKEDFMVVGLNYSCTRCSKAILSGFRWFCEKCKNLQVCERCYDAEPDLPRIHIHRMNGIDKPCLSKAQVNELPSTTEDNDVVLKNDMFESRQVFLGFSQKNNYNFDMLRRAKHSSMMILHHLHTSNKHHRSQNSTHFQVTCTACKKDVSTTIYFSCLVCSAYRACTGCYTKNPILRLLHLFPIIPSANRTPPKTVKVLEILDAMLHSHSCRPTTTKSPCSYPKCNEVKALFCHSVICKVKEKGACKVCKNLWKTLRIHAYHCQDPHCRIPRCRDMKEHFIKKGLRL